MSNKIKDLIFLKTGYNNHIHLGYDEKRDISYYLIDFQIRFSDLCSFQIKFNSAVQESVREEIINELKEDLKTLLERYLMIDYFGSHTDFESVKLDPVKHEDAWNYCQKLRGKTDESK